tara:strand:- start:1442 stop:1795 length:354 start_codon:yes stop_codon:yes gene_type:complete
MGRYYNGDIEGKFWVAVQSSDAADQFGVEGTAPESLEYYFYEEDIPAVRYGIKKIKDRLDYDKVHGFFEDSGWYNQDDLDKNNITGEEVSDYADLALGEKILKCLEKNGDCNFTAEC